MADFPRTFIPARTSSFLLPGAYSSRGRSGKVQTRSLGAKGRAWEEEFAAMNVESAAAKAFLAIINNYKGTGLTFTISHWDYRTPNGTGGGTLLVDGGSQTGSSLVTKGWTAGQTVMKAGDIFLIAGVLDAKDVLVDVVADGGGAATISFGPPILSGNSPADEAALTVTAVKMTCTLESVTLPRSGPTRAQHGLKLAFRESL